MLWTRLGRSSTYQTRHPLHHRIAQLCHNNQTWTSDKFGVKRLASSKSARTVDRLIEPNLSTPYAASCSKEVAMQNATRVSDASGSKHRQRRLQKGHAPVRTELSAWINDIFKSNKPADAIRAVFGQKSGLVRSLRSREANSKSAGDWVLSSEHQQALQLLRAAHTAQSPLKRNMYEIAAFHLAGEK